MTSDTYPFTVISKWVDWGRGFTRYVAEHFEELGVGLGLADAATVTYNRLDALNNVVADKATRTSGQIQARRDALAEFRKAVRPVVAILKTNPFVTDAQRVDLSLKVTPPHPTPAPVPATPPTVAAFMTGPESLRVNVRDPASPDRRARPAGVRQVAVNAHVGEAPPATHPSQWPRMMTSGRTDLDLMLPGVGRDTTVWVSCCWVSSRNVEGPYSVAVGVRLAGSAPAAGAGEGAATMKIAA